MIAPNLHTPTKNICRQPHESSGSIYGANTKQLQTVVGFFTDRPQHLANRRASFFTPSRFDGTFRGRSPALPSAVSGKFSQLLIKRCINNQKKKKKVIPSFRFVPESELMRPSVHGCDTKGSPHHRNACAHQHSGVFIYYLFIYYFLFIYFTPPREPRFRSCAVLSVTAVECGGSARRER